MSIIGCYGGILDIHSKGIHSIDKVFYDVLRSHNGNMSILTTVYDNVIRKIIPEIWVATQTKKLDAT